MKPLFTIEQFLAVFTHYNKGVFPMQILFYLIVIFAIYLVLKPNIYSDTLISLIMAFLWVWMDVVYHLIYFTETNKLAYLFGAFFILQSVLFVVLGVFQSKFSFQFHADKFGITDMSLIVFALCIYPILGYFLGHVYPSSPTLVCLARQRFLLLVFYF